MAAMGDASPTRSASPAAAGDDAARRLLDADDVRRALGLVRVWRSLSLRLARLSPY
jgi:hypothetical protein